MARVDALFVASEGSAPMTAVESVEAVADRGLRGDRYFAGSGYYVPYDTCQVTLVAGEALDRAHEIHGVDLSDGVHRRNVVTRGVDVHELLDHRFRVGDAEFVGTRPRPPCAHVEQVADREDVAAALADGRGGVCADVVESGTVAVGDVVEVVEPLDRTGAIVARLRSEPE